MVRSTTLLSLVYQGLGVDSRIHILIMTQTELPLRIVILEKTAAPIYQGLLWAPDPSNRSREGTRLPAHDSVIMFVRCRSVLRRFVMSCQDQQGNRKRRHCATVHMAASACMSVICISKDTNVPDCALFTASESFSRSFPPPFPTNSTLLVASSLRSTRLCLPLLHNYLCIDVVARFCAAR